MPIVIVCVAWLVALIAEATFHFDLLGTIWVLTPLVRLALAGIALALIATRARRLGPSRAAALLLAASLVWWFAPRVGPQLRFRLHRAAYERDGGRVYRWPGGILDNWCGAVLSPAGPPGPADVPDDQLRSCTRLDDAWWLCCFT